MKKHRSTLFGIALLITIILTLLIIDRTTASTSTCNRPADPSVSGIKRGVVANVLEYDNVEDNDDYDEVSSPKVVIEGDDDDNSTLPLVMDTPGSSIDTMGVLREIPSYVQEIIDKQPEIFNNVTGATNKNLKHRKEFIGKKRTHCVACRLNCMNLGVFAACERK
ncbi:predicted protein [Naegleria gruberi]|uniref:Predicted protein n=1 Tax=Naegleria gruberi TaxID=5762 RepID=D2VXH8_NAEGR|nr:uncharacterized protein NAEGRDRAFT_53029 [Naegleria gruberi]EFC38443.1 predicted protein [Naegleria gruberi]|eukprot:XP_002671187.1 predicted protein [Naegleria gruberi strain NEG-M]